MILKHGDRTLKKTVAELKSRERRDRRKANWRKIRWIMLILALLLVGSLFPGYIIYIEGLILLTVIVRYRFIAGKTKGEGKKNRKYDDKTVRMLPWALLAIYFAVFAVVFTGYGCMRYVFHDTAFDLIKWLKNSISIFLLFEIIAIQCNRGRLDK